MSVKEKEFNGTSYYISPERFSSGILSDKCDIWSCGIIMHLLLTGCLLFKGDTDEKIFLNIKKGELDLEILSGDAKNLIKKLLEINPNKRINAKEALEHDFFKKFKTSEKFTMPNKQNIKIIIENMINYSPKYKFQEAALTYLVHNISNSDDKKDILMTFNKFNKSKNGRLTQLELKNALRKYVKSIDLDVVVESIFYSLNGNNCDYIGFNEFLLACINKERILIDFNIKYAFSYFTKTTEITSNDLIQFYSKLKENIVDDKSIKLILDEIDENKEGKIDIKKFEFILKSTN